MRTIVGCMTGTSLDGLDAAVVRVEGGGAGVGAGVGAMRATFLRGLSADLGPAGEPLRRLADQQAMTAGEIAVASRAFSLRHAEVIREVLAGEPADLICVHGQTVFHRPPLSWQLMQPAPIAHALGVPVVFDLRAMDLAAGGQGAPITPIADAVLFRDVATPFAVVNLGGFANFTLCAGDRADSIAAGDICPCNQLLDAIARRFMGVPFDDGGRRASAGQICDDALLELDGIFASMAGRSLGTGDEMEEWISWFRPPVSPEDVAATACLAIGEAIGQRLAREGGAARVLLAGGGVRNAALREAIREAIRAACGGSVATTDEFGVPSQFREAACFAVLGALCQDRVPVTLPRVTGCPSPAPIGGAWVYPPA